MLRAQILRSWEALEGIEEAWRSLYERSGASFSMSPTWLGAWWATMHDAPVEPFGSRRVLAVAVRDGADTLRGLLMLSRRWARVAGVPRVRLEVLGTGEPRADEVCTDYATLLAEPPDRSAVAEAVVGALGSLDEPWDELLIPYARRDDEGVRALTAAFVQRSMDVRTEGESGAGFAALPDSFEGYLDSLPKKHRYAARRSVQDFETWAAAEGGLSFERASHPNDLEEAVTTLVSLHAARWGEPNIFSSARFRRFHEAVMRAMMRGVDGTLSLWTLRAGRRPVASLYNIEHGGVVYNYQAGRAVDLPKGIKPGFVAHVYAIRRAIDARCYEYDFLPGDALYKRQLGNARRETATLRVTSTGARTAALDLLSSIARRLGKSMGHPAALATPTGRQADDAPASRPSLPPQSER